MKITAIGIDLAKNALQIHGVNERGKAVLKKQLKRDQVTAFFANVPPCLIGMEACGSAHYWARRLQSFGHDVKLMAPQFVKPYVKTNKNDVADAEAICEAVSRPSMRFVPIKNREQQSVLAMHRARQGFVKARTAQANQIRGLLAEYGIVIPQGIAYIAKRLPEILEDGENELPGAFRQLLQRLGDHLKQLDRQVTEPARSWSRFRVLVRSRPVHWWPRSGMRRASRVGGSSLPGLAWCRGSTPPGASRSCWVLASGATATCGCC
jgi:transposase